MRGIFLFCLSLSLLAARPQRKRYIPRSQQQTNKPRVTEVSDSDTEIAADERKVSVPNSSVTIHETEPAPLQPSPVEEQVAEPLRFPENFALSEDSPTASEPVIEPEFSSQPIQAHEISVEEAHASTDAPPASTEEEAASGQTAPEEEISVSVPASHEKETEAAPDAPVAQKDTEAVAIELEIEAISDSGNDSLLDSQEPVALEEVELSVTGVLDEESVQAAAPELAVIEPEIVEEADEAEAVEAAEAETAPEEELETEGLEFESAAETIEPEMLPPPAAAAFDAVAEAESDVDLTPEELPTIAEARPEPAGELPGIPQIEAVDHEIQHVEEVPEAVEAAVLQQETETSVDSAENSQEEVAAPPETGLVVHHPRSHQLAIALAAILFTAFLFRRKDGNKRRNCENSVAYLFKDHLPHSIEQFQANAEISIGGFSEVAKTAERVNRDVDDFRERLISVMMRTEDFETRLADGFGRILVTLAGEEASTASG